MSNFTSIEFELFDITGNNYLAWALYAEFFLSTKGLEGTILEGNQTQSQEKAKAMIFFRHHFHGDLKNEYLTVKDPQVVWNNLKERNGYTYSRGRGRGHGRGRVHGHGYTRGCGYGQVRV
ncbi:hypothetical protein N665_0113s0005 [Sinapis alba]|nr:hypothetical protein N665_0113s0005 [Sinapis alba]